MLGTQLCAEPADVDVDGARAAVVVVAPALLQQLGPAKHAPRVLGEVLEELELLVGQVEQPAPDPGRVGRLVDRRPHPSVICHVPGSWGVVSRPAASRSRASTSAGPAGLEQHLVDPPLRRDAGQATLGEDRDERTDIPVARSTRHSERATASSRRASRSTKSHGGASTSAVGSAGMTRTWWLEQAQCRKHLGAGRQGVRQQQQTGHALKGYGGRGPVRGPLHAW